MDRRSCPFLPQCTPHFHSSKQSQPTDCSCYSALSSRSAPDPSAATLPSAVQVDQKRTVSVWTEAKSSNIPQTQQGYLFAFIYFYLSWFVNIIFSPGANTLPDKTNQLHVLASVIFSNCEKRKVSQIHFRMPTFSYCLEAHFSFFFNKK